MFAFIYAKEKTELVRHIFKTLAAMQLAKSIRRWD